MNLLSKIPNSARGAVAIMGLCAPVVMMAGAAQPEMLKLYMAGYITLCVLSALGAYFVDRAQKKKAKGFSEDIKDNAGSVQGVSDPQRRREIDEMRQQFQRGIDIYKQYGKDLYSLPWYVVVGESGSGKTEALRRSEIGFPDKLQDYWQGTGGTISMHWWFTNRAVILDTAGRLFVSDSSSGGDQAQSQWISFLQMLRKNRSDCPINGLVLVIPATSLVPLEDEAAESTSVKEIDAKAGQIAKQMETLQTELGVRFPVYLLITKTDRIIGFREFFSYIESPEERYQMIGWSNPEPLGKTFDPSSVASSLRETSDRLRRRRMALMKDPIPAPGKKRFEEVDSMFAFPDAFEKLAPKLERYLRHIFAVDEWSSKPPFLRGIYFTSALQQGAVLDEALAKALGLSIRDMEHKTGEHDLSLAKNRSYFLRDFFLDKVFQEKGLVTKGKIARKLSGWKLWIPVGFVSALLLVGLIGWFTGRKPPGELRSWRFLADDAYSTENYGFHPLIVPSSEGGWSYIKSPVSSDDLLRNLNQLGNDHLKSRPKFGWLFSPAVALDGGVSKDRHAAFRTAADAIVTRPLLEAAIDGLAKRSSQWGAEGIPQSDADALDEILSCLSPKASEGSSGKDSTPDLESTAAILIRSAGLPYTSSKNRDLYRNTIGPVIGILKAAHPDGKLPATAVDEKSRALLVTVIDRLFGGGDDGALTRQLQSYDVAWRAVREITPGTSFTDAQKLVQSLNSASETLANLEPQLRYLASNTGKATTEESTSSEKEQPRTLGKRLLQEHEQGLQVLASNRMGRWQDDADRPEESSEAAKLREKLVAEHAKMLENPEKRTHAARAGLASEVMNLDTIVPERFSPATYTQFAASIASVQAKAKAIGIEEIGNVLIGIWSQHFVADLLPKHIGFPLVFDKVRGDNEKILPREEAAAVASAILRVSELSDKSRLKLSPIKGVIESIFDVEKLPKGEIVVKEWEISLAQNDIWFGLVNDVSIEPSRPGSGRLRWDAASGGEGKLLAADQGAKISYTDTNVPPNTYPFSSGNQPQWAPVHWAVAAISQGAQGPFTQFGGRRISLNVKLPATFPQALDGLPTTRNLSE
ncbi:hypothetical protein OVA24_11470 [Luteolibacter sp. SL250]|uniref:type VI secretion protein IcmF/TssM N-terminal domain-containing protein n=1 Tax=Luteolibacter sp. SL250 TaxID=2995170 RepID=UPI002271AB27|nr:type VI secretion protein IcmF/TssM N-terminal domain-containing protein [Luteolibacter sp. SL250]WAC17863.1 hypothetical protein OVA24_11470 [Luteolibacter sp. SL250]